MKTDENKSKESIQWLVGVFIVFLYAAFYIGHKVVESQIIWVAVPTLSIMAIGIISYLGYVLWRILEYLGL